MEWEDFKFYRKKPDAPMIPIGQEETQKWNEEGWDIFWLVQDFPDSKRVKENLRAVRCLAGDFDNISKGSLLKIFSDKHMLDPSWVIETRGGVHCYWILKEPVPSYEGLDADYRTLVESALIPFGADPGAKDVARVLRAPFCRYWHDSKGNKYDKENIPVMFHEHSNNRYHWKDLLSLFPKKEEPKYQTRTFSSSSFEHSGPYQKAISIPVEEVLLKLSGSSTVHSERYSFKREAHQVRILVAGKPSNAWIDRDGKIGSTVGAAPTIIQWLQYYGHSKERSLDIIKELFPERFKQ